MGWLTAVVMAAMWLLVHRSLDTRMEAVARACHELRGPLTAARLGLEFGSRSGVLSSAQVRAIHAELGRATLALDDLLAAPDEPTPGPQLELVDVGALLSDSVHAWGPTAMQAGVRLRLLCSPDVPPVRGDRLRLAQATGNLIANAIEHGASGVQVLAGPGDAGARIEVIDDGPGLPAPLDELVRRPRGGRGRRGRGLAIASRVAAVHGGRLDAAPSDRGAHLVIDLPFAEPAATALAGAGE